MNKIQAAAGGTAVLGLGLTGVGVAGKNEDIHLDITLLVEESDFGNLYSNVNSIGKKYGWYLAGTYGADKDSQERNKKWWEESYKRLKTDARENLSDEFKNVSKGYSFREDINTDSERALNRVCAKIYLNTEGEYISSYRHSSPKSFSLFKDFLKYCSPMKKIPTSIYASNKGDVEYYQKLGNTYVLDTVRVEQFISVFDSDNDVFWKLKNKEFFGLKGASGTGASLNAKSKIFYPLYSKKDWIIFRGDIKSACAEAYILDLTKDADKESLAAVSKYCSWG